MKIAVVYTTDSLREKAEQLAKQLQIPVAVDDETSIDYKLIFSEQHLALQKMNSAMRPLYVDFLAGKYDHRRRQGGGRKQLIARAMGVKPEKLLRVIDATAGLGRDSFVLACLGCEVVMLERSPVVAALVADALERARQDQEFSDLSLELIQADAQQYLLGLAESQQPDVVYLDPMFPERTKSSLVKKEMRMLHDVVGGDEDSAKLFSVARKYAKKRVVVKRPKAAEFLAGAKPDLQYAGKTTRFDVYLMKK